MSIKLVVDNTKPQPTIEPKTYEEIYDDLCRESLNCLERGGIHTSSEFVEYLESLPTVVMVLKDKVDEMPVAIMTIAEGEFEDVMGVLTTEEFQRDVKASMEAVTNVLGLLMATIALESLDESKTFKPINSYVHKSNTRLYEWAVREGFAKIGESEDYYRMSVYSKSDLQEVLTGLDDEED